MKNKEILVSCIITTYKREPEIVERALKSVINQTHKNIEIIIVNDYPEDESLVKKLKDMISKYEKDNKIIYFVMEKNGGACKARNKGISFAKGKYVAFLDDDDEWMPLKIEKQVEAAIKENTQLVYCNALMIYEDLNTQNRRFKDNNQPSGMIFEKMLMKNYIGSCSFPLIEKKALDKVNGFDENMPAMQDLELYLRITKEFPVSYIEDVLIKYYSYSGERITRNTKARVKAYNNIIKKYKKNIENDSIVKYKYNMVGAEVYSDDNKLKEALKYFKNMVLICPFKLMTNLKTFIRILAKKIVKKRKI